MPQSLFFTLIFFTGVASSFVGSIAGGGGLISIPLLIFLGMPAHTAIATDRIGLIGQNLGSFPQFRKAKKILWQYVPLLVTLAVIGAAIGARISLTIDENTLQKTVGVILLLFLPLIIIQNGTHQSGKTVTPIKKMIGYILYFATMIFGGFFGGGAGTLVIYILAFFFNLSLTEASGTKTISATALALSSTVVFALSNTIDYTSGTLLAAGMMIGGFLGSKTAIKKGDQWVKWFSVVVVGVLGIKLLFF